MSIETPLVAESTPVQVTKPVETMTTAELEHEIKPAAEVGPLGTVEPGKETTATTTTPAAHTGTAATTKDEAVVEATPATEGVLGYKAPGLLKQFRYVKHFFWFSEEPLSKDAAAAYVKTEKADFAHHHAAWARETGKGVLFFAKRAEDKATPSGMILLPEATAVTKIGLTDFSFKVGSHTHKFEAASHVERDSWIVAIEKIVESSRDLKTGITGRESYKKTMESFSPVVAGASTTPIKHNTPKKSLDANTATTAAVAEPAVRADASSTSSADESKRTKAAEKAAKKERSQSRKRNSVFGLFGKKDEEEAKKKAEKEHEKEVKDSKKVEKEHIKEEKKIEVEHKKEEAKIEHDHVKAREAAEAAAVAAAPAAVATTAVHKEHERHSEKPLEKTEEVTTPTEKKNKRASVFGGFFGKNKIASPSAEKTEQEAGLAVPVRDEINPAVSETAPKLDEPVHTKPLDTAAVTSPVDQTEISTPVHNGIMEEHKITEPTPVITSEPAVDSAVRDMETPKEERPAREKRRTSLFGSFGTLKRKSDKSPAPHSSSAIAEDIKTPETKREKSPMPSKLGGLFRKPSRAVKNETSAGDVKTGTASAGVSDLENVSTAPTGVDSTVVGMNGESKIVDHVVPDDIHNTFHDAVTADPEDVKTTA